MIAPPTQLPSRIVQLDALRGLAVIGIAWMNVLIFAMPAQGYYNPMAWGGQSGLDMLAWAASFVFIEDKFRTLFALLFGAGCAILLERAGAERWKAHYARMAVLFAIGLFHATLLATNDILRSYALAGLLLPLFYPLSNFALIACSIGLVAAHVGFGIIFTGVGLYDWFSGRLGSDAVQFAERNFGADPAAVQFMLERGNESFGERVERRWSGIGAQLSAVIGSVPLNLAGIVLGMALWRNGMLRAEWRIFRLQRLAAISALASLPLLFLLANWVSQSGFPGVLAGPVALVFSAPFDTLLGLAYAALAMVLFTPGGSVSTTLAAVGRLSLTNYIMTSVIFGGLYASWGFGLFGEVSRSGAIATVLVPVSAMLVLSPLWVKHMGQGPMERLWRGISALLLKTIP